MPNDFRDLDGVIGLTPVADVPPPLLGDGQARTPSASTRVSRPTAARRPTVTRPGPVRPPTMATRADASSRPLWAAVHASNGRMGAEPLTVVVTLLAWLVLLAAVANAYVLFSTGGVTGSLPFSGYVHYEPLVNDVLTWGGHSRWPAWASTLGAVALGVAALGTRGLRQIGGGSGVVFFGGLCLAGAGIAGSVVALVIIGFATGLGIAICVLIGALLLAAVLMLLVGLATG